MKHSRQFTLSRRKVQLRLNSFTVSKPSSNGIAIENFVSNRYCKLPKLIRKFFTGKIRSGSNSEFRLEITTSDRCIME